MRDFTSDPSLPPDVRWLAGTTVKRIDRSIGPGCLKCESPVADHRSGTRTKRVFPFPARFPDRPAGGSLLTKYRYYRPRDYVFRARRWSMYLGYGITGAVVAKWRRPATVRMIREGAIEREWRGEKEKSGLAKEAPAERTRSNDVCLALKEREIGRWRIRVLARK